MEELNGMLPPGWDYYNGCKPRHGGHENYKNCDSYWDDEYEVEDGNIIRLN